MTPDHYGRLSCADDGSVDLLHSPVCTEIIMRVISHRHRWEGYDVPRAIVDVANVLERTLREPRHRCPSGLRP